MKWTWTIHFAGCVLRMMTVLSTLGSENETQSWNCGQNLWRKTADLSFGVCEKNTVGLSFRHLSFLEGGTGVTPGKLGLEHCYRFGSLGP